mmetsp:Transcript_4071/g.6978  ORF Transcript_4071/g.6978 Transcript_4071/m.6978 type:complete len:171 (-) Transcript_4071:314-826(-)
MKPFRQSLSNAVEVLLSIILSPALLILLLASFVMAGKNRCDWLRVLYSLIFDEDVDEDLTFSSTVKQPKQLHCMKWTEFCEPCSSGSTNNSVTHDTTCSICLGNFSDDDDDDDVCGCSSCKRPFHRNCIGEWLTRAETCPLCRVDFKSLEKTTRASVERIQPCSIVSTTA